MTSAATLGGELCLWSSEFDSYTLDPTVWPKASAAAERLWSGRNLGDTIKRAVQGRDGVEVVIEKRPELLRRVAVDGIVRESTRRDTTSFPSGMAVRKDTRMERREESTVERRNRLAAFRCKLAQRGVNASTVIPDFCAIPRATSEKRSWSLLLEPATTMICLIAIGCLYIGSHKSVELSEDHPGGVDLTLTSSYHYFSLSLFETNVHSVSWS